MKEDLYYLIRRYCKSYEIGNFKEELFLHDSTQIQYSHLPMAELDRFISLVEKYWDYLANIATNFSSYEETTSLELSDRITGMLDLTKTIRLRANHFSQNVICAVNMKNIYSPENVMFAAVLLGINILAAKFLVEIREKAMLDKYAVVLNKIIQYSGFILKNRLVRKLSEYYLMNYKNLESLAVSTYNDIVRNKFPDKYIPLIKFVQNWIRYEYILNKQSKSQLSAITAYLNNLKVETLYEIWIFYKILELFEPIEQTKKHDHRLFICHQKGISIQYQAQEEIDWDLERVWGKIPIKRRPDVLVRKNGQIAGLVDAKFMLYKESEVENEIELIGPNRDIVNQMIIYLDHIGPCNLGIVLFSDPGIRGDVVISQGDRRIIFLNCYPYNENADISLKKIKEYIS